MDSFDSSEGVEPWNSEAEPLFLALEAAVEAGELTPYTASVALGFEGTSWDDGGSDLPVLLAAARARVKHGPALTVDLQIRHPEAAMRAGVAITILARRGSILLAGSGTDALRAKRCLEATRAVLTEQALVVESEPESTVLAAAESQGCTRIADSARIHHAEHKIDRWGGTLADVHVLFQLAHTELLKRARKEGSPPAPDIRVNYDDGHESFTNFARFVQADIDISQVRSIAYSMHVHNEPGDWASIRVGSYPGLEASVYSSDRVWALGLTDLLSEFAQAGTLPQQSGQRRALKWSEWVWLALMVVGVGTELVLTAFRTIPTELGLYLLVMTLLLFPLLLSDVWDRGIENPYFKLVPEGSTPFATPTRKPWFSVRVQDWIRKRPILSVTLTFLLSIAANKVSEHL